MTRGKSDANRITVGRRRSAADPGELPYPPDLLNSSLHDLFQNSPADMDQAIMNSLSEYDDAHDPTSRSTLSSVYLTRLMHVRSHQLCSTSRGTQRGKEASLG